MSAPASHRERKKLATREAIHVAAFDLVERLGFSATTIELISERAGVAPRTFWGYFGSKQDAVINRDPEAITALAAAVLARPAEEDAFTALRSVLAEYMVDRIVDSKLAVRRQQLIRREPELTAAVAAVYEEWERGLVAAVAARLGVDPARNLMPAVLVAAVCSSCRVAQHRWADDGGTRPFLQVLNETFRQLGRGLAPLVQPTAERGRR